MIEGVSNKTFSGAKVPCGHVLIVPQKKSEFRLYFLRVPSCNFVAKIRSAGLSSQLLTFDKIFIKMFL
jgi:hypothetical protein